MVICKSVKTRHLFIEYPTESLHMNAGAAKVENKDDYSIGRMSKVFKTVGVAACVAGRAYGELGSQISINMFNPVHWELNYRKRGKGVTVKQWSMDMAMQVLSIHRMTDRFPMETKDDQNLADAITMGQRWLSGDMKDMKV